MTATDVRMDPRIRERRVSVRREAGRRRLRVLVAVVSLALVAAAAYGTTRSPVLDVDHVRVMGANSTPPDDVRRVAGLTESRQMLDVDPAAAARRVEQLPWVQQATVARSWPGTVEITLLERSPIALMPASAGGWALVDATGRVLAHVDEQLPGITPVSAPEAAPDPGAPVSAAARGGIDVVAALPPVLRSKVARVRLVQGGDIEIDLDGGPPVLFGPPSQVRPKLVALGTLISRTNLRGVRVIDVRVPTAPVLTRS